MIDREYLKFNTSLQTASNSKNLVQGNDNTVEAKIELRLPNSVFTSSDGQKEVDNVQLLTTKMRLSMSETPIAQLPLTPDEETQYYYTSGCQLDVYPYAIDKRNEIEPLTKHPYDNIAFPYYKNHTVDLTVSMLRWDNIIFRPRIVWSHEYTLYSNCYGYDFDDVYDNPDDKEIYKILKKAGAFKDFGDHTMNLVIPKNRDSFETEDGDKSCFVYDIAALEQLLADALSNAMTYAATETNLVVNVEIVDYGNSDPNAPWNPKLNMDATGVVQGCQCCFWRTIYIDSESTINQHLNAGIRPTVRIGDDTFSISYDSACFEDCIPIIWNPSFVKNYEYALQLISDTWRAVDWSAPPPKRFYKYGFTSNESGEYKFLFNSSIYSAAFNIIGNKLMKETFPFLPWSTIKNLNLDKNAQILTKYQVVTEEVETDQVRQQIQYSIADRDASFQKYTCTSGQIVDFHELLPSEFAHKQNYFVYAYIDVNDNPRDRTHQCLYFHDGRMSAETITYAVGAQMTTVHTNNETVETTVTDEYETTEPEYPIGRQRIASSVIADDEPIEEELRGPICIFHLFNGDVMGVSEGRWDTQVAFRPMDSTVTIPFYKTARNETTYEFYDYNIMHLDARPDTYAPLEICDYCDYVTAGTVSYRNEVDEYVTVTPLNKVLPPIESLAALPNLMDSSVADGTLYMLDGTGCQLTISEQEPTENMKTPGRFKIVEDITPLTHERDEETNVVEEITVYNSVYSHSPIPPGPAAEIYAPDGVRIFYNTLPLSHHVGTIYYHRALNYDSTDPLVSEEFVYGSAMVISSPTITRTEHPESLITRLPLDPVRQTISYTDVPQTIGTVEYTVDHVKNVSTIPTIETYEPYEATVRITCVCPDVTMEPYPIPITTRLIKMEKPEPQCAFLYRPVMAPIVEDPRNLGGLWRHRDTRPGVNLIHEYYIAFVWLDQSWDGNVIDVYNYESGSKRTITGTVKETFSDHIVRTTTEIHPTYAGNVRLTFTWSNLPSVIMSPIQSIVLLLTGVNVTQEMQPVNVTELTGSSLTSVIPIIENYYSTATTLRDLHDELVVARDSFDDAATYTYPNAGGEERTLTFTVKFITKDGTVHQLFVPKNGVFSLQVTFGISYYIT